LICVSDKHWESLLDAMGRRDMLTDPKFVDLQARVTNIDELDQIINAWTSNMEKDELVALLSAKRIPCAPVREIDEVVNDPHMHARGTLKRIDHPELGNVVLPASPMVFPGTEEIDLIPSKSLGQDNETVFGDWLGLEPDELKRLIADGTI